MISVLIVVAIVAVGAFFFFNRGVTEEALAPTGEVPSGDTEIELGMPVTEGVTETEVLNEAGATAVPVAKEVTVSMTDTGFEPAQVSVAAGTTVVFVNNGQALHWPASAPHPQHTGLPGFDANKGLATGETYSFVFDKVGRWGFHDHLNTKLFGAVTVE